MSRVLSDQLLQDARNAYHSLDVLKTYKLCLQSLEADPANVNVYHLLEDILSVINFSFPSIYNREEIFALTEKSLKAAGDSPAIWSQLGILHKLDKNYKLSGDAYFQALFFGERQNSWNSHYNLMFKYAYTHKNRGNLELFNRIIFSLEWNIQLFRKIGRMVFPQDVIEEYLVTINFRTPPIRYIKQMQKHPERLYLITTEENINDFSVLARFIGAFMKKEIRFRFFYVPPRTMLIPDQEINRIVNYYFPPGPIECPAAARTEGFTLKICPMLAKYVEAIIQRLPEPWTVEEEKHPFCRCR